jgi:hypothetical protein
LFGLAVFGLNIGSHESRGDEPDEQKREFTILIDDNPRGHSSLTIRHDSEDSQTTRSETEVRMKVLGLTVYRYSSHSSETWKRGRLESLDSTADFNGELFTVRAETQQGELRVLVNGREQKAHADVWTTSYWKLPKPLIRSQPLRLLECDKGQDLKAALRHVGDETLTIAGREEKCAHYQLTGDATVDLWFDTQERMVRQELFERGHSVKWRPAVIRQ